MCVYVCVLCVYTLCLLLSTFTISVLLKVMLTRCISIRAVLGLHNLL